MEYESLTENQEKILLIYNWDLNAPEQSKIGHLSKRTIEVELFIVEQITEDPYISREDIHDKSNIQ